MARILLTGATGFLGSHLAHAFLRNGHEVAILKRTGSDMNRIASIADQLMIFDLDAEGYDAPFRKSGPYDAVVHTATCYGRQGESSLEIFRANTLFPLELMEKAASYGTAFFINTDTFFNVKDFSYEYLSDYALSKKQFSQWGKAYSDRQKLRFINIILEHLYGPGDAQFKFCTWIIRQCLMNVQEIPLTKADQKRDFIFIDDAVSAYVVLIENLDHVENYFSEIGLGSGKPISIKSFVNIVHESAKSSSRLVVGAFPSRKNEIMYSKADTSFLKKLGWKPEWSVENGILAMIQHEKAGMLQ
jgi:CDP-paratose synthetase